jgi:hypothetical protein
VQRSRSYLLGGVPTPGIPIRPVEVTCAFIAIVAGAALTVIGDTVGFATSSWPNLTASAVVVAVIGLSAAAVWFAVLPIVAALQAARGRRWPVVFLSLFAATQVLTLGFFTASGALSTVLMALGCVLLWLPKSREYSRRSSAHRSSRTVGHPDRHRNGK